jgi:hypothetical protein
MRVLLQGLRSDADERALVELIWDHTPETRPMAHLKVGLLRCEGTLLSMLTMPEELEWFVLCAQEFGVKSVLLLGAAIHE